MTNISHAPSDSVKEGVIVALAYFLKKVSKNVPEEEKFPLPAHDLAIATLSGFELLLKGSAPFMTEIHQNGEKEGYPERGHVNICLRRAQTYDTQKGGWVTFGHSLAALQEIAAQHGGAKSQELATEVYTQALQQAGIKLPVRLDS